MTKYTRREFVKVVSYGSILSASMLAGLTGCSSNSSKSTRKKKVIVLGIDGLDPNIMERMMDSGQLPNFSKLREMGCYSRLMTVNPPQSPVVWSSIATGNNPGYHGVYDFIIRNPRNYLPELSMIRINPKNITGSKDSMFLHARKGKAFWQIADDYGVPSTVIRWPVTFPAEKVAGNMFAGYGTPDIKGGLGRYTLYTTRAFSSKKKGDIIQVYPNNSVIETKVTGPAVAKLRKQEPSEIPMIIKIDKQNSKITLNVCDKDYEVKVGGWSDWVRLKFSLGFFRSAYGIVRFYLSKLKPDFELYMTPIQIDQKEPAFPISYPDEYAGKLAEEIGYYHTLGMPEDTNAFGDDILSTEAFLESCDTIMVEREKMLRHEINRFKEGLLAFVFDTTDRIQHMFWSTRDPEHPIHDEDFASKYGSIIPDYYRRMDKILGKLLKSLSEKTVLIIVSDHGFTPFRRTVHINSWLAKNGFMTLKQPPTDSEGDPLFKNVDWEKTKAYSVGFTSVYLNLKGREEKGIVEPGDEEKKVKEEIIEVLKKFLDPKNGQSPIREVYDGKTLYSGSNKSEAPDLVVGFNHNYRASWQTAIGGTPASIISDNAKRWSGDHLMDANIVPGIFFMNQKTSRKNPTVLDIAPTVLKCLDIPSEKVMQGVSLL